MSRTTGRASDRPARGKPRLLILTPDFPPAHGGVQVLVHQLARSLSGFELEVITLSAAAGDAGRFDAAAGLSTRRIDTRLAWTPARMLALNAAALWHAARFQPDLTLSAHIVVSPAAAAIRRLLGTPTAQYFYASELFGKPRLAAFAAARADLAIAISSYTASLAAVAGAAREHLVVIPPGVTLPDDRAPLPVARPTVLTLAQLLYRYKGHDVLIRALAGVRARVPDVEWVVIGDGPLRASLEALASASGLDGCARFLGDVDDARRVQWLRCADVMAMPSRLPGEGFGIAYLEAGAYGKPVLAGNVGGPLDAVADGVSGLLVDPTDAAAVAAALERLLLDRELAGRLGAGGAERAREHAWPAIAGRVEAALLETVAARA